jgi:hypothetical protein
VVTEVLRRTLGALVRCPGPGEPAAGVPAALVGAPGPVTAGWVREQLAPALACTTVVTTLTRMYGK